jgi:hypothetical protein
MYEIFSFSVKIVLWGNFLLGLKTLTRDFRLQLFFMYQFPRSPEYPVGAISNFYKNRGVIRNFVFSVSR